MNVFINDLTGQGIEQVSVQPSAFIPSPTRSRP
jgi:hypothetical protein